MNTRKLLLLLILLLLLLLFIIHLLFKSFLFIYLVLLGKGVSI